jgi:hypothetical protein
LLAANRILVVVVSAIGLPLVIWLTNTVVVNDRVLALVSAENQRQGDAIRALERSRDEGKSAADRALLELAGVREQLAGMQRGIARIESYIDRRTSP